MALGLACDKRRWTRSFAKSNHFIPEVIDQQICCLPTLSGKCCRVKSDTQYFANLSEMMMAAIVISCCAALNILGFIDRRCLKWNSTESYQGQGAAPRTAAEVKYSLPRGASPSDSSGPSSWCTIGELRAARRSVAI